MNHWAAHMGGAEFSLLDILEGAASKADVHLVTSENGELVKRARRMGVNCHVVPAGKGLARIRRGNLFFKAFLNIPALFSFLIFSLKVRKLVNLIRPDCIHANVPKSHMLLFLLRFFGYRGRTVIHIREIFVRKSVAFELYGLLFSPEKSIVIAISQAVRDGLPEKMRKSAVVIHNGIFIPSRCVLKQPKKEGLSFVYLGRIVPWKGCHILIEAFSKLQKKYSGRKISLTLAGGTFYWDETYRDELRGLILQHKQENHCSLLPHVSNVYSFLARYDVFCTGSQHEPFGRSVAEAQSCALPVVAFESGGIAEIVEKEETGFLAEERTVGGIAAEMEKFVLKPGLAEIMGEAGRRRVERNFERSVQVGRIEEELVGGLPRR
ncbi:MAG: glycosyltransferase [Chitinispirillaceae bacterium]